MAVRRSRRRIRSLNSSCTFSPALRKAAPFARSHTFQVSFGLDRPSSGLSLIQRNPSFFVPLACIRRCDYTGIGACSYIFYKAAQVWSALPAFA